VLAGRRDADTRRRPRTETDESLATHRHHVTGGTYTVVYELAEPATVTVGALGDHQLSAGGYAYTGSALGSGGFARVDRHRRVAAGEHDVRHWHVDYLGGHPAASVHRVRRLPERDVECAVAQALGDGPVAGFGASDCDCASHLAAYPDAATAVDAVEAVHSRV
jgi:endonuclease-3